MPLLDIVIHNKTYSRTLNILGTYSKSEKRSLCVGMEIESLNQVAIKRISDTAVDTLLEDWDTNDSYRESDSIDSQIDWSIYLTLELYSA